MEKRQCSKHWMTHTNRVPRDPTETPRNTATPLTSAGRRMRVLQYSLQGMWRADIHPVKPGKGAWRSVQQCGRPISDVSCLPLVPTFSNARTHTAS
ncbi:hypothetical protein ILYODFUR_012190 [Ilyodon furcidens]|uniref:Uncharacterized protein n=1 Tax=Ilyodon furcidens TaxID=33524 RepID=A0ABV0URA2_9TELE